MKKVLILVISIIAVLSGACSPFQSGRTSGYTCSNFQRTPANNSYFQPLWSRSGIAIYPDPFNPLMQGTASKVFLVTGQDSKYGGSKILALDTQSGSVLWQRNVVLPASIITSSTLLYTSLYDKIEVVDPQTGNLVKTIEVPKVGFIYNVFATEHNLYAFTKSGRYLTYNINDGSYSLSEPFLPYHPFLIENGIMYFVDTEAYKAKDIETQSILWENSVNDAFTAHPLFTHDMIILLTRMGSIYSLDKGTGKLLWKLDENVISNIAVNKSDLYFVTNDGYLKMLDMNSGQEIAKLEFVPASFEPNSPPSGNIIGAYDLWVDSQNDIAVVSFGDSCQLMAIKLQTP